MGDGWGMPMMNPMMMAMMAPMMMGAMGGKGGGGGGGWGAGPSSEYKYKKFKVDKSGGELGEFTGVIKSFADKTGYGFIDSDEVKATGHDADIFLHGDMKKNFQKGNTVKFTCVINKDGKPVAIDLKKAD